MYGRIGFRGYSREDLVDEGEGAITLSPSNFVEGHLDYSKCSYLSWKKYYESPEIMVQNGDIVFVKTASIGKVALVRDLPLKTTINPQILVFKNLNCNASYLNYYLQTSMLQGWILASANGSTIYTISQVEVGNYPIFLPPLDEQSAIAAYLDAATAKIDAAIDQQQKMIDLLNERKQIIINRAVTKGLNPNAKMKDSGVEWIGEVPEDWEVRKTLFCLSMPITDGPHETPQLYEEGIPFVSAEAVSCGNGKIDFDHIRGFISKEFYDECCKKYIPKVHDIYMIKSGATTGKVAIVDTDRVFTIWSPLAVFRCNNEVVFYEYMFYLLQSNPYQLQVQLGWSYGTQQNIGMRTLEKLKVPVPPLTEQKSIAGYIKDKCKPIDEAIDVANKQISLLQERKQIIINEVVTGKVNVQCTMNDEQCTMNDEQCTMNNEQCAMNNEK
jgi:type I restriction enzyme S subunit